jgi:hypothetical protein
MCGEHFWWILFPLMFLGMMILCAIFSRRRGGWSCCSPWDNRYSSNERIRKLEEEIDQLKRR